MAEVKWKAFLSYQAKDKDIENYVLRNTGVPVMSFSVKGGAKRIVVLDWAEDLSLGSEFEQARSHQNLTLHLPPSKNFEWLDFIEIAERDLPVAIQFGVWGEVKKTPTQAIRLTCDSAKMTEKPDKSKTDGTTPVMTIRLAIPNAKLIHGSYPEGLYTEEEW